MNADVNTVLQGYGIDAATAHIVDLGNAGGYSGANLWRVLWQNEQLCLRRWSPEHPSEARLRFIHDVLQTAARQVTFLPVPRINRQGKTYSGHGSCWWELTPWMPGTADFHQQPTATRLNNALRSLAHFHQSLAHFPDSPGVAASPAMKQRLAQLNELRQQGLADLQAALPQYPWTEVRVRATQFLALFDGFAPQVQQELIAAERLRVPLQPCIRDIWHDHVLFIGDEVTGIVDFGAVRMESVAGDVERLLRSLIGGDEQRWQQGLAAYQQVRPLSTTELQVLAAFDSSSALLTGFVWLKWLFLENRQFENPARVLGRLDEALARLVARTKWR